jgi:nicotinamide-nucleotide amidase
MGAAFYGLNEDYPLERVIAKAFKRQRATLAVAESCTGGMLAKQLTDIPGSSGYFLGGVVSYSNKVKSAVLGVPTDMLRNQGAVSKEVALAMAKGVRARAGSTWGLGITGIAGPAAATADKPIGLVYIALSGPGRQRTLECRFRGSREAIRQRAVISALNLLRQIYL